MYDSFSARKDMSDKMSNPLEAVAQVEALRAMLNPPGTVTLTPGQAHMLKNNMELLQVQLRQSAQTLEECLGVLRLTDGGGEKNKGGETSSKVSHTHHCVIP